MKFLFTLLSLNLFVLSAQNEHVVELFSSSELNNKVLLNWTISQGNTCNGIDIYRSIDGVNYSTIGDIEGVCGSPSKSINYTFTDLFPEKNEVNYYRLGLGGLGYSYNVNIEVIDIASNAYQIRPNPINDKAVLLFNNDTSKEAILYVNNKKGDLVYESSTIDSKFELGALKTFPAGLYFFTLNVNNKEIKGKISLR